MSEATLLVRSFDAFKPPMLKPLVYLWASPATLLGLLAAALSLPGGGRLQVVRGVLEVHGGFATWFLMRGMPWMASGAAAMTLGHVILGCDARCLEQTRRHEHVHVRQYERWGRSSCRSICFIVSGCGCKAAIPISTIPLRSRPTPIRRGRTTKH